ncbi:MAG: SPOR domain-containing protein [Pseudomonadota bacterium]
MIRLGSEADMADVHTTHQMGATGYDPRAFHTAPQSANPLKVLTHLTGAALSLALLVGVGVWGYKLVARDVSGIPVVRAAAGEMRVRPEDPGGQMARNTGLAVNEVAALGTAAAPADTLLLAPQQVELQDEDIAPAPAPVAEVQQPDPVTVSLQNQSVADVVAALTEGVAPIIAEETPEAPPVRVATAAPIVAPAPVDPDPGAAVPEPVPAVLSGPGMNLSLRPQLRPAGAPAQVVQTRAAPAPAQPAEMDAAALPAGTRLAQLGAYDSAEVARSEWARFQSRFGAQLSGKDRVVQRAQSGGRTFYRLRAHGFADLAEARRFCNALVAAGQDCIPVVTR